MAVLPFKRASRFRLPYGWPFWRLVLLTQTLVVLIVFKDDLPKAVPVSVTRAIAQLPVYYRSCGDAPHSISRGQPGYRDELDADGDGVACEWSDPPNPR